MPILDTIIILFAVVLFCVGDLQYIVVPKMYVMNTMIIIAHAKAVTATWCGAEDADVAVQYLT